MGINATHNIIKVILLTAITKPSLKPNDSIAKIV